MYEYRTETNPFVGNRNYIYTMLVDSLESIVPLKPTRLMQVAQSETGSEKIALGGRAIISGERLQPIVRYVRTA